MANDTIYLVVEEHAEGEFWDPMHVRAAFASKAAAADAATVANSIRQPIDRRRRWRVQTMTLCSDADAAPVVQVEAVATIQAPDEDQDVATCSIGDVSEFVTWSPDASRPDPPIVTWLRECSPFLMFRVNGLTDDDVREAIREAFLSFAAKRGWKANRSGQP